MGRYIVLILLILACLYVDNNKQLNIKDKQQYTQLNDKDKEVIKYIFKKHGWSK